MVCLDSDGLAVSRQCALVGVHRSEVYAHQQDRLAEHCDLDQRLLRLIDAEYTKRPFYGNRRVVVMLYAQGYAISRKRVQRLMGVLGSACSNAQL